MDCKDLNWEANSGNNTQADRALRESRPPGLP